ILHTKRQEGQLLRYDRMSIAAPPRMDRRTNDQEIRMNRMLFSAATSLVLVTASAAAQQQATITGRVSRDAGVALPAAPVFIESLGIGTQTGNDGRYSLIIPAARVNGQRVRLSARLIGFRADTAQVVLSAGNTKHDFV